MCHTTITVGGRTCPKHQAAGGICRGAAAEFTRLSLNLIHQQPQQLHSAPPHLWPKEAINRVPGTELLFLSHSCRSSIAKGDESISSN